MDVLKQSKLTESMSDLECEVLGMKRLEGWGGEGELPITEHQCLAAIALLRHIRECVPHAPKPFVSASRRGAVVFRWVCGTLWMTVWVPGQLFTTAAYLIGGGAKTEAGVTTFPGISERLKRILNTDDGEGEPDRGSHVGGYERGW